MSHFPQPGEPAPDFTLPSTSGVGVTLSSLRGRKVLLAFFPLAFTSTCTAEMCAFTDDFDAFTNADTTVLGISVDAVPSLREYKAKERIGVDLLSDFKREVSRKYATLLEDKFYSNRAYVLIDREGIVRWSFEEPKTGSRRDNAELLEEIRKVK